MLFFLEVDNAIEHVLGKGFHVAQGLKFLLVHFLLIH